jgi:hypothetical protein
MGQYWIAVNITKRQWLRPSDFGDGAKLLEVGASGEGMMLGLAVLLADGNDRGGGDLHTSDPIVGSWAGERVVIAGDYGDPGKFVSEADLGMYRQAVANDPAHQAFLAKRKIAPGDESPPLYAVARILYENVSAQVIRALSADGSLGKALRERGACAPAPSLDTRDPFAI